jgi:hypothetical protein
MSPTSSPQDPQPGVGWAHDNVGGQRAGRTGGDAIPRTAARTAAIAEVILDVAPPGMDTGNPRGARADGDVQSTAPPFGVEALERLSQRLTMAGLRLASLRRRLAGVEDRMMLIQASDDLDEAIAEVRRLALTVRGPTQR